MRALRSLPAEGEATLRVSATTLESIPIEPDASATRGAVVGYVATPARRQADESARLAGHIAAIGRQDHDAFAAFYDATHRQAYALALRITQNSATSEEVVRDTFMQVWRDAERFDAQRGRPLAWLMTICRSRALDALRRHAAANERDARGADMHDDDCGNDAAQDLLAATERKSVVHDALASLEPQRRQLLALAYFRGLSHSEIAGVTGLPVGTVKTHIRRSLLLLRERLTQDPARTCEEQT